MMNFLVRLVFDQLLPYHPQRFLPGVIQHPDCTINLLDSTNLTNALRSSWIWERRKGYHIRQWCLWRQWIHVTVVVVLFCFVLFVCGVKSDSNFWHTTFKMLQPWELKFRHYFSSEMGEFHFQLKEKLQNLEEHLWAPSFQIIKADIPYSVTALILTPNFELYAVWCGSKTRYQKGHHWLKKIGLRTQNLITILGSTSDIIGGLYDHLMSTGILHLVSWLWCLIFILAEDYHEANGYNANLDLLPISY